MVRPNPASRAVSRSARTMRRICGTACSPVADQLVAITRPGPFAGTMNQRGDDRSSQDGLRDHHRRRGVEQLKEAERSRSRQCKVQNQSDHHRRQAEKRVGQDDEQPPSREKKDCKRRAQRKPDRRRDRRGCEADTDRKSDYPEEIAQGPPPPTCGAVAACGSMAVNRTADRRGWIDPSGAAIYDWNQPDKRKGKKQGAAGITTAAPYIAGQWGRGG